MDDFGEAARMPYVIIVLTIFMILGVVARLVIRRNNLNIPYSLFTLGFSIVAGATIANVKYLRDSWLALKMVPQYAICAYTPVFITSTMYNMDHHLFNRYLLQATLVTLSNTLITPIVITAFLTLVLYPNWTFSRGLLLSLIVLPLEPRHVIELFQVLSNYKFLATMLQTETVLILVPHDMLYGLIGGYRAGVVDEWYQFLAIITRFITGGAFVGFLMAVVHMQLMLLLYREPLHAVGVSLLMIYITYFLCKFICNVNGPLAIIFVCAYLVMNKHKLTAEVDTCLLVFWSTFYNLVETPMLMFAMTEVTIYALVLFEYTNVYDAIFLYFLGNLERLRACLMLTPLLNRMSHNVNAKSLFVLGWSGARGTINLHALLLMVGWQHLTENMQSYLLAVMCYVVLSHLINCTTMKVLLNMMGLLTIATTRLANMYNCMIYLREKQLYMLDILKTNRYLSNANWALVRKESFVYAHYLHEASAYRQAIHYNEEYNFKWNDRILVCPDCHKEFRNELSAKEIEDLLKKNFLNIFKNQKVYIIKQYENGCINKNVLQILTHHLDTKRISNKQLRDAPINLDHFNTKSRFLNIIIKILMNISYHRDHDPPENHYRRLYYYFVLHFMYEIVLYAIIVGNAIFSLWNSSHCCKSEMYWYHIAILFIHTADYIFRIIAFGKPLALVAKCRTNWRAKWDMYDFILLTMGVINVFTTNASNVFNWTIHYIPSFRTLSALYLITGLRLFGTYSTRIIESIDFTIDNHIALRFELASTWLNSIEEILNALPQIVTEKMAREYFVKNLNEERRRLLDEMAAVQKTRPWIAVTVKTRQAVRMTLFAMEVAMTDMNRAGYTDVIESAAISKVLMKPLQFLRKMKFVKPNALKVTFKGVPWMPHENEEVMEYLYKNTEEVSRDANEPVMKLDMIAEGVYVVVTGVLILAYQPKANLTRVSTFDGHIPIVDYLATTDYESAYEEVVVSGCTVGELGVLTERPYDCTVYAGSPSQGYWLPTRVIRTAMRMCSNPVTGMEVQMWHHCCENLAVAVIMHAPKYRTCTKDEVKTRLKNSFVPILRSYKTFVITDMIEDVVLINGMANDSETGNVFIAPKLIPTGASTLNLVQDEGQRVNLWIVPRDGFSALQVMEIEEELAELLPQTNSNELLLSKMERKMTRLQAET